MFPGREESVKSTNVARDKPMSTDSSPKLEHAAWQNGARPCVAALTHAASAHSDPARSTAPEQKIGGGFQLVSPKVQYTSPGLACSADKAKSRCWAPQAGSMPEEAPPAKTTPPQS